jgi:N-acetylmuramoyl-L-alanine amidase
MVSVAQWGGTPANATLARPHTISRITLHHQGVAFPRERDPQQYLRDLQSWSRATKAWIDVPYHYIIDLDGRVYEGRDIRFASDTNTSYDPLGHALIEVVGNFEEVEPSAAQLEAVANLMALLAVRYSVPVENIRGHRDYADTECPGKNLYRYLENGYFHQQVRARLAARGDKGDRQ